MTASFTERAIYVTDPDGVVAGDALRDAIRASVDWREASDSHEGNLADSGAKQERVFVLRSLPELFPGEGVLLVHLAGTAMDHEDAIASLRAAGLQVSPADTSYEVDDE